MSSKNYFKEVEVFISLHSISEQHQINLDCATILNLMDFHYFEQIHHSTKHIYYLFDYLLHAIRNG